MYVVEGSGRVFAFDAASGDAVWIHERQYPEDITVSQAFGRHRGVSIYGDALYWGTADAYLVALDAQTGKLLWEVKTGDYHSGEGHNHPPLIAEGKVFLGHAGGDRGARGRFRAYDAEDGTLLWTVYTAPGPGDPGYETWARRDVPPLGGAPWNTASYDPELRLVYFSTGQPAPWSSTQRGLGDALYTNSVVAVDAQSGKIRWHFQLVPADDWDRAAYENMLVDLVINGRTRKALIQTGKIGWGVVLDRETGEFLHAFRTAYDNVVTGWTPQGRPIINPAAIPKPEDVGSGKTFEICPHLHGARNLQAPSYSPLTRLYYAGINNSCMNAQIVPVEYAFGRSYTGVTYTAKLAPGYDYVGEFVAFDPSTGQRKWAYRPASGAAMTASALATGGGIVFGGTADRQFFALHSETGQLLWQTRLNGDISGAPVTFEVGGRQYVAVGAGGRPGPTTSFAPLTNVDLPQGSGAIWVFALPEADNQTRTPGPARPVIRSISGAQKPAAAAPSAGSSDEPGQTLDGPSTGLASR
jgi:alcohol dehydrogenase (cytochrome c)